MVSFCPNALFLATFRRRAHILHGMARGGESMREWQGVSGDVDDMIFVDDWFVSER